MPAARVVFSDDDRREIAALVSDVLAGGVLTLGSHTREFEAAFAAAHQAEHAVAVSSGTAALEIILRSLDVAGHEVVVPANTFAATAFAVLRAGAVPVFADVDPSTFALSAATAHAVLTPRTRAVVVVHLGGLVPPQVEELTELCASRGVPLVEDAAHAHGASYRGRHAGSFGVAGAYSFYPTKVITTGEGGMIVTADERIAAEARLYRDQGKAGFLGNVHVRMGYAWRMSELQAAVGKVHLRRLPEFLRVRQQVAETYDKALAGMTGFEPLRVAAGCRSNYYKYIVSLPAGLDRDRLKTQLRERHEVTLSGEVYETPLHLQPVFQRYAAGGLPAAETACARHVCLPVHSDMTAAEAEYVVGSLAAAHAELAGEG